jgi:hypothetical protein
VAVAIAVAGSCVVAVGGLPAAGSLQAVMANASNPNMIKMPMNFFVMIASFQSVTLFQTTIFYIILAIGNAGLIIHG